MGRGTAFVQIVYFLEQSFCNSFCNKEGQTDGRYQMCYLPALLSYTVDNDSSLILEIVARQF